jgi:hypothetical protein
MGLDQYLNVRKYFGGYDFCKEKETYVEIVKSSGMTDVLDSTSSPHLYVSGTAIYWRKANSIHGWFNGLTDEVDNCQEIPVSRDHLEQLSSACKTVLLDNSMAYKLLPPTVGFLFGGEEVDEWYLADLEHTYKEIDKLLEKTKGDWGLEFVYQASW